jgi:hypothetical protein
MRYFGSSDTAPALPRRFPAALYREAFPAEMPVLLIHSSADCPTYSCDAQRGICDYGVVGCCVCDWSRSQTEGVVVKGILRDLDLRDAGSRV